MVYWHPLVLKIKKESMSSKKIGTKTASTFVIANMIGTGVFTSLGFQLVSLTNPIAIALIWLMGGLVALCGAIVYSELGAAMPRSGGEYHYLSVIYHPMVGFMSGWTSLLVGFAAPVALSSMAMSSYLCNILYSPKQKIPITKLKSTKNVHPNCRNGRFFRLK